jgi:cytidylate kinase
MVNVNSFERCLAFINCQLSPSRETFGEEKRLAVTISRQTGSGAFSIAQKLADYLQARNPNGCPWTVFDKNLIEKVLEEHQLPTRIAKFLPEDSVSGINDALDELLGLHPPSWIVVRQTTETILKLAELGNVILIGRGASVITSNRPNVLHARLVGSLEKRIARLQAQGFSELKAKEFIESTDRGRVRYLKKYFHRDIKDLMLYDLVVNTDRFNEDDVARLIGDALVSRAKDLKKELTHPTSKSLLESTLSDKTP